MDMISTLPQSIIENILCLVPIQEAARTSILATEWRYHWTKIPKLVFNEDMFQVSTDGDEFSVLEESFELPSQRREMTKRCKLFYAIYQVLLKHEGPIHEFTLSMNADTSCVEIDHIIFHLARNNTVKKLRIDDALEHRLPVCFFSLNQLTDLHLTGCDLVGYQPTFNGFHNLTSLYLEFVGISKNTLLHLLSRSPLLKSFTLYTDNIQGTDNSTITDLFECLPAVENMSIWLWIVRRFVQDGVPQTLPTALIFLKYLYIDHMCFKYEYGLPFLILLLKSSPNLENVKLQIFDSRPMLEESETRSFKIEDYSDIWLEHLNELAIINVINEKPELDFVKLILAKSPVLKKMKIFLWKDIDKADEFEVHTILLSSPRASPMVEILFEYGLES